jgi:hypothetical protein
MKTGVAFWWKRDTLLVRKRDTLLARETMRVRVERSLSSAPALGLG